MDAEFKATGDEGELGTLATIISGESYALACAVDERGAQDFLQTAAQTQININS